MRRAYLAAWRKFTAQQPLNDLERQLAQVIVEHREYHRWLEQGDDALQQDFTPEQGRENPFLHLGMHLAIREQLSTDRPPGIVAIHARLARACGDPHEAEHRMMGPLGAALWEAQRSARAPDETAYLDALRRLR